MAGRARLGIALAALAPAWAMAQIADREWQPDSETVLLLHLNEESGTTLANAVPDGPQATIEDGTKSWSTDGRFGRSLSSNEGEAGHVSAPLEGGLFAGQQFTMDAWIRPSAILNDAAGASYVMGWRGSNNAYSFIRLYPGGRSAAFCVQVYRKGESQQWAELPVKDLGAKLLDGQWHHIAGTYREGTLKLYVDGEERGSATPFPESLLVQPTEFIAAGGPPWKPTEGEGRFIGDIDEIRVSNVAREEFGERKAPSRKPGASQ